MIIRGWTQSRLGGNGEIEADGREEVASGVVVSGSDAPDILNPTDGALNDVA